MIHGAVMVISDVHTKYEVINTQIRHAEQMLEQALDHVLVLGDFGFFRNELHDYFRRDQQKFLRPVFTLEGNHEDHSALARLVAEYADVVTYLPRGSLHNVGQWSGLCLGGVRYMDAATTPRGSEITDADVDACLCHDVDSVDIVLTHDCPSGIGVRGAPGYEHYGRPGVPQMSRLGDHYGPRLWLFGHHHTWFDGTKKETRYVGLPQSWKGYVLLRDGDVVEMIDHDVPVESIPWWRRWL